MDFKNPESKPEDWITSDKLCEMYQGFIEKFPVVSIEDAFDQDDWEGWTKLTGATSIQIVGDDLTVTNPKRIQMAVDKKACNCLLLKVNQIGSVTESIGNVQFCTLDDVFIFYITKKSSKKLVKIGLHSF